MTEQVTQSSIFTIRIPPQQKYMTRVRTAKGSLYFELLRASFFLIELLASIHLLVCIWYAWVNCRISICKKLYFKALHCNVPIIIFCSLWSCCYTLEVSSSTKDQDQLLIIQVLINLLKYHLMPKGCKDVIDDEVVSLSYSFTVAIYVRTFKDFVASTSPKTLLLRDYWFLFLLQSIIMQHRMSGTKVSYIYYEIVYEIRTNRLTAINAPASPLILPLFLRTCKRILMMMRKLSWTQEKKLSFRLKLAIISQDSL